MKTKILIVEDEMVIAANTSLDLSSLGYEVTGILSRAEEALNHIYANNPDIVLLDILLRGKMDGITLAHKIKEYKDIPIIFLTANADDMHFERAKETKPHAFISKPFKKLDLQRAVELVVSRMNESKKNTTENKKAIEILEDYLFIRDHEKMIKVSINDIQYIEAERNYCRIFCSQKDHLIVMTLKDLEAKLPSHPFVRIHRSYIINLSQIEEVTNQSILIKGKTIPISKPYRDDLLQRLHLI
jgi:DNA-binding LytR/AlgR family response regulator